MQQRWGTSRAIGGRPGELTACCMAAVELPELPAYSASAEAAVQLHDRLRAAHGIEVPVICWEGRLWVRLSSQVYNSLGDYGVLADAVAALR